ERGGVVREGGGPGRDDLVRAVEPAQLHDCGLGEDRPVGRLHHLVEVRVVAQGEGGPHGQAPEVHGHPICPGMIRLSRETPSRNISSSRPLSAKSTGCTSVWNSSGWPSRSASSSLA